MAIRAACASTNFLTATTWAVVDTSVTSGTAATYLASEVAAFALSTTEATNRAASGFTPGAITIDGIGLRIAVRSGTTGTLSVQLFNLTDTAVVAGTLVTINVSDMPATVQALLDGGWTFFKFSAPVTLTAAKAYVISPVTSSAAQISLYRDATTSNWSRYLRTTTTGAPAAGDDMIIAGEWTAAATVTTRTVTMDETAATDYGSAPTAANGLFSPGIAIGEHGRLRYNDASAANPLLQLSNSLIVYNGGILDLASTLDVTVTIASPGVVTWTSHGFETNRKITLRTTGALPTGLSSGVDYYVRNSTANTFELSLTSGGTSINTSGSQSGTHTAVTGIPRDSTAILQFDLAADGDYALVARNGSIVNKQGLSRTSGKNVVSAKLLADSTVNLMQAIGGVASALTVTAATTTLDPTGTSLGVGAASGTFNQLLGCVDTAGNSNHKNSWASAASVTNTTQVYTQWIKRGSGTNNRFVRLQLATSSALPAVNGFFADFDLQTPSAGTCTALGNGTATSAAIAAFGGGFICTIIGKISSGASSPTACIGACNASTVVSYAGDATQNFICSWPQVYTLSAQPTQDTIDTDTGWLSGDVVALASTTRTANECEVASLASNAGASTLTYNLYPVNARSGTSPTQAEVILLSRNVKVRSTNPTLMTYVNIKSGAVVDIDWAEFYYLGIFATGQRGVEVELGVSAATNFSMQFSSIHDTENCGFVVAAASTGTITSLVFSSNSLWNCSTTQGPACQINSATNPTGYTFDSNILLRTGSGNGWTLADLGGTFTNNTVVGAASVGIAPNEAAVIGTMSGNVAHSNGGAGYSLGVSASGTITTPTFWRNGSFGFTNGAALTDVILDTPTAFGNTASNFNMSGACDLWIKSPTLNGDTTFATTNGININSTNLFKLLIDNGDFSTVSGIKTAHTNDINITSSLPQVAIVLRNTKLGAATEVATPSNLSNYGFIASEKHDGTAGNHMSWMKNGLVQTDTTIFNISTTSMRMTPTSASLKLESAYQFQGLKVAVNSGSTVTVSVYTRKSVVGDGVAYNGNQPRLILKANPAIGISTDTVMATASVAAGSWGQISGTTAAATDNGAFEFVVDCDGTAGWVNQGDWSAA